jgi:hypothetical protein
MQSTAVLSCCAAHLLKLRTDMAHTPVSMLGKIFNTSRFPLKSDNDISDKSAPTNLKSGACTPFAGTVPTVFTVVPLNVTVAIFFCVYVLLLFFVKNSICKD